MVADLSDIKISEGVSTENSTSQTIRVDHVESKSTENNNTKTNNTNEAAPLTTISETHTNTEEKIEQLREARKNYFEDDSTSVALFRAIRKLFEGGKEKEGASNPTIHARNEDGSLNESFLTKVLNRGDRSTIVKHAIYLLEKDPAKNRTNLEALKETKALDRETEKGLSSIAVIAILNYYEENTEEKQNLSKRIKSYFKDHIAVGEALYDVALGKVPNTSVTNPSAKQMMEEIITKQKNTITR